MKYAFIFINLVVLVCSKANIYENSGILTENEKKKIVELSQTITDYSIILRLTDFNELIKNDSHQKEYDSDNERFFSDECLKNSLDRAIVISYFYSVNLFKVKLGKDVVLNDFESILKNIYSKNNRNAFELCYSLISDIGAQLSYNTIVTQNSKDLMLGVLIFLVIILIFYVYKTYTTQTIESLSIIESSISEETIHSHVQKLLHLGTLTNKESNSSIEIEYCVICMGYLNPNFIRDERNGVTNSNIFLTQFNCSHIYHSSCLSTKNIIGCVMCIDKESKQKYVIPKFRYFCKINYSHIQNIIERLNLMYNKRQLEDYYKFYKSDNQQIKKVFPSYDKSHNYNNKGDQYTLIEMRNNNREEY